MQRYRLRRNSRPTLGLLPCTPYSSTRQRRRPGLRRGQRLRRCLRPESWYATPSSTASPGAMKQWRDDVDRLLGMAHSTSTRSSPRSSRWQREATASVRSPSVRGAQTDDLRAELNRMRTGEDARVSIERARERRQNVEGRNLDRDFAAEAPQTPVGARFQTGVPLTGMGCATLADHLRTTSWPPKFRPHLPEKYDGTTNPSEFLQVYVTAIMAAGGNTAIMATFFMSPYLDLPGLGS
jgi:hypothetical protein